MPGSVPSPADYAKVAWAGDSREVIRQFPAPVRQDLGFALECVQLGEVPPNTRAMNSIGPGVFELRQRDERAWYRVIYLKKIGDVVHVLHCFEKKSSKTRRQDLETARIRLRRVLQRMRGN